MDRDGVLGATLAVLVCICKIAVNIFTPLFLDCLNPLHTTSLNISKINISTSTSSSIYDIEVTNSTIPVWQRIDPFFGILISMGFDTLLFGTLLLALFLFVPGMITERETKYPKRIFIISGSFQAISALFYQFSTSGKRTPPFLQGALDYFLIPQTFILRFFILRRRPTVRKLLCAVIILLGELVCLLPTMFPSLESNLARQHEGGATGIGRIIWPIVFVVHIIPHALWNILLEKGAKAKSNANENLDQRRLNIVFVMFWNFFGTFITTLLLFWIDFIPGFGLMQNVHLMLPQVWFNLRCIFGAADVCGLYQMLTAWGRMISKTSMFLMVALLVRYGEGANLYATLTAITSPAVFIIFALFDEQALRWSPQFTLSTWLGVGALMIMLPTVIIYNTGSPEIVLPPAEKSSDAASYDDQPLIDDYRPPCVIINATDTDAIDNDSYTDNGINENT